MSRTTEYLNLLEHNRPLTFGFSASFLTAIGLAGYLMTQEARAAILRYAPGESLGFQNDLDAAMDIESDLVNPAILFAVALAVAAALSRPLYKLHKQVND